MSADRFIGSEAERRLEGIGEGFPETGELGIGVDLEEALQNEKGGDDFFWGDCCGIIDEAEGGACGVEAALWKRLDAGLDVGGKDGKEFRDVFGEGGGQT